MSGFSRPFRESSWFDNFFDMSAYHPSTDIKKLDFQTIKLMYMI